MGFDINEMLDKLEHTDAGAEIKDKMKAVGNSFGNIIGNFQTGQAAAEQNNKYNEPIILPPPEVRGVLPSDFQFLQNEQVVFRCEHKKGGSWFNFTPVTILKAIGALLFGIFSFIFAIVVSTEIAFLICGFIFLIIGLAGAFYNVYDSSAAKRSRNINTLIITNMRIIDSSGMDASAVSIRRIINLRIISNSKICYEYPVYSIGNEKPIHCEIAKLKNANEVFGIIVNTANNLNAAQNRY